MNEVYFEGNGIILDISRQPYPEPCSDCCRIHLNGEHVEWRVPTPNVNENRLVWSGCIDCFLRRTAPSSGSSAP